jgi:hypothetical protein
MGRFTRRCNGQTEAPLFHEARSALFHRRA